MNEVSIFVQKETLSTWQRKAQEILEGLRQIERSNSDTDDTVVSRLIQDCIGLEAGLRHTQQRCVDVAGLAGLDATDEEQDHH